MSNRWYICAYIHVRTHTCSSTRFIDCDSTKSVASALVGACIDYCNSILHGTSRSNATSTSLISRTRWLVQWLAHHNRTYRAVTGLSTMVVDQGQNPVRDRSAYTPGPKNQSAGIFRCADSISFCFSTQRIWNRVPHDMIDNQLTLAAFKYSLKTFLFNRHFAG